MIWLNSIPKVILITLALSLGAEAKPLNLHDKELPSRAGNTSPATVLMKPWSQIVCGSPTTLFVDNAEDFSPWTSRPQCVKSRYVTEGIANQVFCIYTKKDFADDRGVSIITTPDVIKEILEGEAFTHPKSISGVNNLVSGQFGPPPYRFHYFPGKGRGLVANRTIYRGERIMQETPTFIYDRAIFNLIPEEDRLPLHWHAMYQLNDEAREELLDLHKHHGGDEIDDLMRTNAFGAFYVESELHNNVLPRISKFNHDCRPNAHYYFDPSTMTQYVHAVRTIGVDEEITINYTDSEYSFAERQTATQLSWGFSCKCSLCRQPRDMIDASDRRIRLIQGLKKKLNDWTDDKPDRKELAELLVLLYEQERLDVPVAVGYEAATYAYSVAGDEIKTIYWATKAVEAMTVLYGGSHILTRDLVDLMTAPRQHRTWMYSLNETESVPVGDLDDL